jgi:hypothetical protein
MSVYSLPLLESKRKFQLIALVMFTSWLGMVLFLAWNHVVWRDEVRALSLALQGENVFAMLKGIHGEGHPAVWYLLLRIAHALVARPEVLQLVALIVASAAVVLLLRVLLSDSRHLIYGRSSCRGARLHVEFVHVIL